MKARYTPAQRQKHLQAWQSSGLSQSAYCREHKLKLQTFSHWHRTQNKAETMVVAPFIPVQVTPHDGDGRFAFAGLLTDLNGNKGLCCCFCFTLAQLPMTKSL